MSTIDTLSREAGEAFLHSLPYEIRDETVRQGIRRIAEERFRVSKLREEVAFEKEMLICILSPKNTMLAQKLEEPRDLLEDTEETLKDIDEALTKLDGWKNNILKNSQLLSVFPERFAADFNDEMTQARIEMEKALDEDMQVYRNFNAQDWTNIKKDLDAKRVPISYDFFARCDRVAQSTIAA
jgi:Zn-dependent M16 (insulinase) family peptidase